MSRHVLLLVLLFASYASSLHLGIFGEQPSLRFSPVETSLPETVEVVRWQQPVCVAPGAYNVTLCTTNLRKNQRDYESASVDSSDESSEEEVSEVRSRVLRKTLISNKVRDAITIDEIEPSSFDGVSEELRERETPALDDDARVRRHFYGRLYVDTPLHEAQTQAALPPIRVTKVLKSPTTATLLAQNCLPDIGVPLCRGYEGRVVYNDRPMRLQLGLDRDAVETSRDLSSKKAGILEAVNAVIEKKKDIVQGVIDKKLAVEEAIGSVTQDIVNKKKAIVEGIVKKKADIFEAITEIAQGLIDMKHDMINGVVQHFGAKKEFVVDTLANITHKKMKIVNGAVEKKKEMIDGLIEHIGAKKNIVVDALKNVAEKKMEIVNAAVEKKQKVVGAVVDHFGAKKDFVVDVLTNVHDKKMEIVNGAIEKKQKVIEGVVDAVKNVAEKKMEVVNAAIDKKQKVIGGVVEHLGAKKDFVVDVLKNVTEKKMEIVNGVIEKKKEILNDAIEKKKELVDGVVEHFGAKKQYVVDTLKNVAEKKVEFVHDAIEKKKNIVNDAIEKKQNFIHASIKTKQDLAAAAGAQIQAIVEQKKEAIQNVAEAVVNKHNAIVAIKKQMAESAFNKTKGVVNDLLEAKTNFGLDLANKKQTVVQSISDKKIGVIEGAVGAVQGAIQHIGDTKTKIIKTVSDKTQEMIGTASLVKPFLVSTIQQNYGFNEEATNVANAQNEEVADSEIHEKVDESYDTADEAVVNEKFYHVVDDNQQVSGRSKGSFTEEEDIIKERLGLFDVVGRQHDEYKKALIKHINRIMEDKKQMVSKIFNTTKKVQVEPAASVVPFDASVNPQSSEDITASPNPTVVDNGEVESAPNKTETTTEQHQNHAEPAPIFPLTEIDDTHDRIDEDVIVSTTTTTMTGRPTAPATIPTHVLPAIEKEEEVKNDTTLHVVYDDKKNYEADVEESIFRQAVPIATAAASPTTPRSTDFNNNHEIDCTQEENVAKPNSVVYNLPPNGTFSYINMFSAPTFSYAPGTATQPITYHQQVPVVVEHIQQVPVVASAPVAEPIQQTPIYVAPVQAVEGSVAIPLSPVGVHALPVTRVQTNYTDGDGNVFTLTYYADNVAKSNAAAERRIDDDVEKTTVAADVDATDAEKTTVDATDAEKTTVDATDVEKTTVAADVDATLVEKTTVDATDVEKITVAANVDETDVEKTTVATDVDATDVEKTTVAADIDAPDVEMEADATTESEDVVFTTKDADFAEV